MLAVSGASTRGCCVDVLSGHLAQIRLSAATTRVLPFGFRGTGFGAKEHVVQLRLCVLTLQHEDCKLMLGVALQPDERHRLVLVCYTGLTTADGSEGAIRKDAHEVGGQAQFFGRPARTLSSSSSVQRASAAVSR